jgi:hypothetical protein
MKRIEMAFAVAMAALGAQAEDNKELQSRQQFITEEMTA